MSDAKRDENFIPTLLGVSSVDGVTPVVLYADPTTHRLYVDSSGVPTTITVANEATDTTCFPLFVTAATGDLGPKTNAGLTFNSNTGNFSATLVNSLTLASQSVGFTVAGGTTSKTLTVDETASLSGKVDKSTYDAHTILYATTDNTPVALTVTEQTVIGRATGGNITALAIDSDLSSVSSSDDTIPSAKATKAMGDLKLPLAGGTMTGKVVSAGRTEVGKTYTPATGAQTVALDCSVNNVHIVTGHADGTAITFTVTGATDSQCFIVSILQGSGTVSTITSWFSTVRWAGGTTPTLTATLNKRDTFGFIRTGTNTYDGFVIGQNC